jgi:hypothetical protein
MTNCHGDVEVTTVLTEGINSVEYVKNHHFIRFARKDGTEVTLVPQAMVLYACVCEFAMLTASNHGAMKCPICNELMQPQWMSAQTCFVPEKETAFKF